MCSHSGWKFISFFVVFFQKSSLQATFGGSFIDSGGWKCLCLSLSVCLFSRIAQTAQTPWMRLTGVAVAMCECQLQWLHKLRDKASANLKVVSSALCWRDWRSCPVVLVLSVKSICKLSLDSILDLWGWRTINSSHLYGLMAVWTKFNVSVLANKYVILVSDTGFELGIKNDVH